jgi:integrase
MVQPLVLVVTVFNLSVARPHMKKSTDIRTLKALNKPQRYSIPNVTGLHLFVKADLSKYWVYRYTYLGQRYDLGLGSFPAVTLAEASAKALKMKGMVLNGINPVEEKKAQRQEAIEKHRAKVTFKKFALNYIETFSPQWTNDKHADQWVNTLTSYAFPVIGDISVDEIKTGHILEILSPIWTTKTETATRVRGRIAKVISAAITAGHRTEANPALWSGHLEHLLPNIRRLHVHHPALPYAELPDFMSELASNNCMSSLALQFTILNAARTGETIYGKRTEIVDGVWSIPAERMKAKKLHQVPLCPYSLQIIEKSYEMEPESKYIFSNGLSPLSSMAMLMLLRGYRNGITVHGFRSTFRDYVSEETEHSPEVAEMALAHVIQNRVEAAYRRGRLLERRRLLMLDWEAYCLSKAKA